MKCTRAAWCSMAASLLLNPGCGTEGPSGDVESSGRARGRRDAAQDIKAGILKLKEYPALPYSAEEIRYIRLLQDRCGVGREVLDGPGDDRDRRAEVEAYNEVMSAAIRGRFGPSILADLRREATGP